MTTLAASCSGRSEWSQVFERAKYLEEHHRYRAAADCAARALSLAREGMPDDDAPLAWSLLLSGSLELRLGRFDKAVSLLKEAFSRFDKLCASTERNDDNPLRSPMGDELDRARCAFLLGKALAGAGDLEGAERWLASALEMREQLLSPLHEDVIDNLVTLAEVLSRNGHGEEAEARFEHALDLASRSFGPESQRYADCLLAISEHFERSGEFEKAVPFLEKAAGLLGAALRHRNDGRMPDYLKVTGKLVRHYISSGNERKAVSLLEERVETIGATSVLACPDLRRLGDMYASRGEYGKAEAMYRWALSNIEHAFGRNCRQAVGLLAVLREFYEARGRHDEALSIAAGLSAARSKICTRTTPTGNRGQKGP